MFAVPDRSVDRDPDLVYLNCSEPPRWRDKGSQGPPLPGIVPGLSEGLSELLWCTGILRRGVL